MQKILLYYKFVPLADPDAVLLWQHSLCQQLNLKGRIIIADHGINGTLGGELESLKSYIKSTKQFAAFHGIRFKWADASSEVFPKLSVKVRQELVTFGATSELAVNENGLSGGGKHLKPKDLHKLIAERGEEVMFFDGRSSYEAAVGKFKDAVIPDVLVAKEFIGEIEKPKYDKLKKRPVVTYCTGGIRCEVLSVLMKNRGWVEVYQLDGGIVEYGQTYGDEGLWEGSLYVFDGRMGQTFSDHAKVIGSCVYCQGSTSDYTNCENVDCNALILRCSDCLQQRYCPACQKQTTKLATALSN